MDKLVRFGLLAAAALPLYAGAADFDGSRPLVCATTDAVDVTSAQDIVKARPADLGAPSFLRLDIAHNRIIGPKRTSPIRLIENDAQQIVMQGTEAGFGWTIALDKQNGNMTLAFADRAHAVVLTGACTPG
jgi:hypothetical protein